MNLFAEKKWVIGGFSLAMLLTGFSGYVSYLNASQLNRSINKVEQVIADFIIMRCSNSNE
jgi:CHASE3 domain sensor protein